MGRKAETFALRPPREAGGIYYARYTVHGRRFEISTGERDEAKAKEVAAKAYSDALLGLNLTRAEAPKNTAETASLWEQYLNAMEGLLDKETIRWRETCAAAHLIPAFRRVYEINPANLDAYVLARLKVVQRFTVVREISALFCMLAWAGIKNIPRPKIPDLEGKRASTQREDANRYTEAEAKKIIMALPKETKRRKEKGGPRMLIRQFFAFMWETGLRPATIAKLTAPRHWDGGSMLTITKDIDKKRYAREVPLTDEAQAILRDVMQGREGVIFGFPEARQTRWRYFKDACVKAGVAKASQGAPYDFRHSRAANLLDQPGNTIRGIAFMFGWRDFSMANRYGKADLRAAEALTCFRGNSGGAQVGEAQKPAEKSASSA